ncbi:hypothetical protein [Oceanomicrobium pacificus]|uniref:Yip1 domain-containing protein n=1 Tax=Oceanomicrobium pacificus TaxID=2692916 RepID=A0A6B0TLP8_9RHOB|nr:hypothetical protein [Oceanomicrobium pacificus]MXU65457.1 hypothetical protein [Oceanomicrobium pacificus]
MWELFDTVGRVLSLDPDVFRGPVTASDRVRAGLVVLLAGMSMLLGQCFSLFLVSASAPRFILGLVINGVMMALRLALWITLSTLVASALAGRLISPDAILFVVFLSTAPMIFGFIAILPTIGPALLYPLYGWVCVVLMYGLFVANGVPFLFGAVCGAGGLFALFLLDRYIFLPVFRVSEDSFYHAVRFLPGASRAELVDRIQRMFSGDR